MQHKQAISTLHAWLSQQDDCIKKINRILTELNALTRVDLEHMDTYKVEKLAQEITTHIDIIAQYESPIAELMTKNANHVSEELTQRYAHNQEMIEDFVLQYNNFIQHMEQQKDLLASRISYAESFIAQL